MDGHSRVIPVLFLVLAGLPVMSSCGDDGPTGPTLGDLTLESAVLSGGQRNAVLTLRNVGQINLGPTLVGLDQNVVKVDDANELCDRVRATVVGSPVPVLAPGADQDVDITINMDSVQVAECPIGTYSAPFFASVSGKILGGGTIQFEWDGTPP